MPKIKFKLSKYIKYDIICCDCNTKINKNNFVCKCGNTEFDEFDGTIIYKHSSKYVFAFDIVDNFTFIVEQDSGEFTFFYDYSFLNKDKTELDNMVKSLILL